VRLILCERHGHVCADWDEDSVREYVNVYNGLEQDGPIIGPRIPPQK
jgi:hypothetical protein